MTLFLKPAINELEFCEPASSKERSSGGMDSRAGHRPLARRTHRSIDTWFFVSRVFPDLLTMMSGSTIIRVMQDGLSMILFMSNTYLRTQTPSDSTADEFSSDRDVTKMSKS